MIFISTFLVPCPNMFCLAQPLLKIKPFHCTALQLLQELDQYPHGQLAHSNLIAPAPSAALKCPLLLSCEQDIHNQSLVLLMCFCPRVICLCTKSPFSVWLFRSRPGTFSRPEWKRAHGFSPGQFYPNTEWLCNCEPYRARNIIKRWTQTWEEDSNMKDYTECIRNIENCIICLPGWSIWSGIVWTAESI